jgi:hypothetical protein
MSHRIAKYFAVLEKMVQWYLVDILDIKGVFTEVTLKMLSDKKSEALGNFS